MGVTTPVLKPDVPRTWREMLSDYWGATSLHGAVFRKPQGFRWVHCNKCRSPSSPTAIAGAPCAREDADDGSLRDDGDTTQASGGGRAMGVRVLQVCWHVVLTLRPPLTKRAMHGWACPKAVTVTDDSYWWGGQ